MGDKESGLNEYGLGYKRTNGGPVSMLKVPEEG